MNITCEREKLLNAFLIAAAVAPARSPKPILQNVKLEVAGDRGVFIATDLEVGVRVEVPDLHVEAPGSVILPVQRFGSILRESSDQKLLIETDGQSTVVRGERSEFKLPAENPAEFPAVAGFNEKKYFELPARLLRELVRRTVFATDNESSRYALGGVLFELGENQVTAVATDGRRLARMEGPGQMVGGAAGEQMTIVPSRAMQLIERSLTDADAEVMFAARANDVLVKSPRVTIYSRLVEGRFPKWRDVFPREGGAVRIELVVGPLHSAVRQAAIVTNEESRGVDFAFGDGKLVLSGRTADVGQSRVELPIAYAGENVTVTLDPRYMSDFLKVLDSERTITLDVSHGDGPVLCRTDDGYAYIIMPLARDR